MKNNIVKGITFALVGAIIVVSIVGSMLQNVPEKNVDTAVVAEAATKKTNIPKYVFLFIGDGMSYPQIQAAMDFYGKDASGSVSEVQKSANKLDSPKISESCYSSGYICSSSKS